MEAISRASELPFQTWNSATAQKGFGGGREGETGQLTCSSLRCDTRCTAVDPRGIARQSAKRERLAVRETWAHPHATLP